jgi:hypothetical protein
MKVFGIFQLFQRRTERMANEAFEDEEKDAEFAYLKETLQNDYAMMMVYLLKIF